MKKWTFLLIFIINLSSLLSAEESHEEKYPVVILGGGIGAMTSATYLSRAGIQPLVITGPVIGGTITLSNEVQNWPGELSISGDVLSEKVYKQAEFNGAFLRPETVVSVDFSQRPFTITVKPLYGEKKDEIKAYKADTCIIAMGANPNLLHVPGESLYLTHGVFTCAVCDGALYKNKIVAVAGGGDSALIEAQYLSNIAKKVYLIVRRDQIRAAEMKRAQMILSRPNIEVLYETTIQEIKGKEGIVTHLVVQKNNKELRELPVNALFLAIGSNPNTNLFRDQLELDEKNYILLKKNQQTSVEGVYAIGDIADPEFKQAISAAGDGAKAALQAQKFLASYLPPTQKKEMAVQPILEKTTITEIFSKEEFYKELKEANGPIFVDFYSNQCSPCRAFKPIYDDWANTFHNKIKFLKVNVATAEELFNIYQINAVPTLIIFDKQGKVILKSSGMHEIVNIEKFLQKIKDKQEIFVQDFK